MTSLTTSAIQTDADDSLHGVSSVIACRRSLLWRVHAWAAFIASPFALLATLTGSLYIFTPQIEHVLYGSFEQVQVSGERHSLDELVAVALSNMPGGSSVRWVQPGNHATDATKVTIVTEAMHAPSVGHEDHQGHEHGAMAATSAQQAASARVETTLYVNPYTATVIGNLPEQERFSNWARKLHSTLLQGEAWRWMIELAASWLLVMLLTGIYLWWPRGEQSGLPKMGRKGRVAWKQWHSFAGVALGALTFIMLATGVTWSKYAGAQVRAARDVVGQAPLQVPRDLVSMVVTETTMLTWQAAWDAARRVAPDVGMQLVSPRNDTGTWRINNADKSQPTKKFDLVLDAYSGRTLYYAGWNIQTAFSKATAVGIPFHRGELGIWNQVLLIVFAFGMLFSLLSGWVMFFNRKRSGPIGLPLVLPGALKSIPLTMWLVATGLFILLPLLALSALWVLLLELYWWRTRPRVLLSNA